MDYNVFLSHNSKDKPIVEQIGLKLKEKYSLKCWLDKWNLVPGEPWQEALEEALDQCQTIAVFVGPNTISPWENEEMRSALETRVRDKSRRVIPVLLPGAPDNQELKLPKFLTRLTWVDMRTGLNNDNSLFLLYCGIKGIAPEEGVRNEDKSGTLPLGSHIPFPRNALFTGREKELEELADSLLGKKPSATLISQAITGMGGIGKTQLAVEFAYRYGYRFKGAHWLDLRDPSGLDSEIAKNGSLMNIRPWLEKEPEQVQQTLRVWQTDGPRLLILDNFEDISKSNDVLKYFQNPSLRVLVTSRHKDFPKATGLQIQELDIFTAQESSDFLEKTLENSEEREERNQLAEKLGRLPLAMELAIHYINVNGIKIHNYLEELDDLLSHESMQAEWFKALDILNPTEHDQSLLATFELSWKQVKDEIQQKAFILSGYCAPNTQIPLEIFQITLELDDKSVNKALYRLNALGLLRNNDGQPTIHPLLAAYAQKIKRDSLLLKTLAENLGEYAKNKIEDGLSNQITRIYPHIPLIAQFAEHEKFEITGLLLDIYGSHLAEIANFVAARDILEYALKIDEANFGSEHPNVARDLNDLGDVLESLGDYIGAKAMFERALQINEAIYGSDHPNNCVSLNNIGSVMRDLGDYAGAKAMFEHALQINEVAFGPDHLKVAENVNDLGLVLQDLGDFTGAKAAFKRALLIQETAFGPDHQNLGKVFSSLGLVLQYLGDYTGAKAMLERALVMSETRFGSDHPNVARALSNLGSVLQSLGDLLGAEAALKRAVLIHEAVFGPDHPDNAMSLNNLGGVLRDLGNYKDAKVAIERALKISETALGRDHPDIATFLSNLGGVLRDLGDYEDSKVALERALIISETALSPDHPDVASVINNLGNVLRDLGDYTGAKAAFERALPIYIKTKGKMHSETAEILNNLGAVVADLGNYTLAINYMKQASNIMQQTLSRNHPLRKLTEANLQALLRFSRNPLTLQQRKHKKH